MSSAVVIGKPLWTQFRLLRTPKNTFDSPGQIFTLDLVAKTLIARLAKNFFKLRAYSMQCHTSVFQSLKLNNTHNIPYKVDAEEKKRYPYQTFPIMKKFKSLYMYHDGDTSFSYFSNVI